ncbi:hypothetical protein [Pelagicoccus sp. SDUM812002]|uniref:hypothetical protein n=1 Tax=Pelagicoccus sp. SDUM812002 TaxID=3041266 RepID=UPI00280E8D0F|nr:hypothetical protein [Pelagicoccus sp. SDUM812002]MDQ8186666.1 hypothetical protein [Pelagicoccus sp. SDUM812002]
MKTTALLTGAGSIENGWAPVLRALDLSEEKGHLANFIFSTQVYQLRFFARQLVQKGLKDPQKQECRKVLKKASDDLSKIKAKIAKELHQAQDIHLRRYFSEIYTKHISGKTDGIVPLTTNWDLQLEKTLTTYGYNGEVLHLHGSIAYPETLYLPTEAMGEPYWNEAQQTESIKQHEEALRELLKCKRLILYGISISELDPELGMLLGATIREFEEVVIVDPNPNPIKQRIENLMKRGEPKTENCRIIEDLVT